MRTSVLSRSGLTLILVLLLGAPFSAMAPEGARIAAPTVKEPWVQVNDVAVEGAFISNGLSMSLAAGYANPLGRPVARYGESDEVIFAGDDDALLLDFDEKAIVRKVVPSNVPASVEAVGDFDKDGSLELFVVDPAREWIEVRTKDGSVLFRKNISHGSAAVGDFDGDGLSEIVVTNDAITFFDDALNGFRASDPHEIGLFAGIAGVGDFDEDGDDEVVVQQGNWGVLLLDWTPVPGGASRWEERDARTFPLAGNTGIAAVGNFDPDHNAEVAWISVVGAQIHVQVLGDVLEGGFAVILSKFEVKDTAAVAQVLDVKVADVDGDQKDDLLATYERRIEVVAGELQSRSDGCEVNELWGSDTSPNPRSRLCTPIRNAEAFQFSEGGVLRGSCAMGERTVRREDGNFRCAAFDPNSHYHVAFAALRLGSKPAALGVLHFPKTGSDFEFVGANLDGVGGEEWVVAYDPRPGVSQPTIYVYRLSGEKAEIVFEMPNSVQGSRLRALNLDGDGLVVEFLEVGTRLGDIKPIAVLAAPPTVYGTSQSIDGSGSFFGASKGRSRSFEWSLGFTASLGFKWEADGTRVEPITGKTFGVSYESTLSLGVSVTGGQAKSRSTSISLGYEVPATEDAVVFAATDYQRFKYLILASSDNDPAHKPGNTLWVELPGIPGVSVANILDYNALNGNGADLGPELLAHVKGDPRTYPSPRERDQILGRHESVDVGGERPVVKPGIGDGSTSVELAWEDETETTVSFGQSLKLAQEYKVHGGWFVGTWAGEYVIQSEQGWSWSLSEGSSVGGSIGSFADRRDRAVHLYTAGPFAYRQAHPAGPVLVLNWWVDHYSGPGPTWPPVADAPQLAFPRAGLRMDANDLDSRYEWTRVANAHTYQIQFADDAEFKRVLHAEIVLGDTFKPLAGLPNGTFHWRARGLDGSNQPGPWSAARGFVVGPVPDTAPRVDAVGAPDLTWTASTARPPGKAADRYQLQLTIADAPGVMVHRIEVPGTSHRIPDSIVDGSYVLRVRGANEHGAGPWSDPVNVTLTAGSAPASAGEVVGFNIGFGATSGSPTDRRPVDDVAPAWDAVTADVDDDGLLEVLQLVRDPGRKWPATLLDDAGSGFKILHVFNDRPYGSVLFADVNGDFVDDVVLAPREAPYGIEAYDWASLAAPHLTVLGRGGYAPAWHNATGGSWGVEHRAGEGFVAMEMRPGATTTQSFGSREEGIAWAERRIALLGVVETSAPLDLARLDGPPGGGDRVMASVRRAPCAADAPLRLYDERNWAGACVPVWANGSLPGFGHRTSSLRVAPGWEAELFTGLGGSGARKVVSGDQPIVGAGFDNQVASVKFRILNATLAASYPRQPILAREYEVTDGKFVEVAAWSRSSSLPALLGAGSPADPYAFPSPAGARSIVLPGGDTGAAASDERQSGIAGVDPTVSLWFRTTQASQVILSAQGLAGTLRPGCDSERPVTDASADPHCDGWRPDVSASLEMSIRPDGFLGALWCIEAACHETHIPQRVDDDRWRLASLVFHEAPAEVAGSTTPVVELWLNGTRSARISGGGYDGPGYVKQLELGHVTLGSSTAPFSGRVGAYSFTKGSYLLEETFSRGPNRVAPGAAVAVANPADAAIGGLASGAVAIEYVGLAESHAAKLVTADLDGDGDKDVVALLRNATGGDATAAFALRGPSEWGPFVRGPASCAPASDGTVSTAAGDLDGDGSEEVVCAGRGSSGAQAEVLSLVAGSLVRSRVLPLGGDLARVAVGDVAGDARAELLLGSIHDTPGEFYARYVVVALDASSSRTLGEWWSLPAFPLEADPEPCCPVLVAVGSAAFAPPSPDGNLTLRPAVNRDDGRVVLSWTRPPDSTARVVQLGLDWSYEYVLAKDPGFRQVLANETGATPSFVTPILPPTPHYFRIRGSNGGGFTPWAETSFDALGPAVNLTDPPVALGPVRGERSPHEARLRWAALPGAVAYVVEVEDVTPGPMALTLRTNGTSLVLPETLLPDHLYKWRVAGITSRATQSPWNNRELFGAAGRASFEAPQVQATSREAFATPPLSWSGLRGADAYQLEIRPATDELEGVSTDSVSGTRWTAEGLSPGIYRALVRGATAAGSVGPWSSPVEFTVVAPPSDSPRIRATPTEKVIHVPLLEDRRFVLNLAPVRWDAVAGADAYEIQVGGTADFQTVLASYTTSGTSWDAAPLAGGEHWIRVRATQLGNGGPWSETMALLASPKSDPSFWERLTPAPALALVVLAVAAAALRSGPRRG